MAANRYSPTCSSMPSSRPNPIARNSESNDPMRRSFSGSPFGKPSSIIANSRGGFGPNTPVNSPSDFPRRSSFGRENSTSLCDYEDKENAKSSNLSAGRVTPPASTSNGTKNFMSPTISAASKFTRSPRKKILVERNEPFRSSVLFPDAKSQVMEDNNVKPEICSNKKKTVSFADAISLLTEDEPCRSSASFPDAKGQVMEDNNVTPEICSNKKKTVAFAGASSLLTEDDALSGPEMSLKEKNIESSHDSTVTDMVHNEVLKTDSDLDSEVPADLKNDIGSSWENVTEKDCVNLDPTFKISPRTSGLTSPMLAPLDADPLMPPYDPKTNYLSPRPQFLHYKPNPRIELMHNQDGKRRENVTEKDCVNLDPTFKISPRTSCLTTNPMLAPLDADPLMPPYDPKTNYLSPRPQFLHYNPNPRIELMHNQDGKRLDGSLISENLSDSEVSETLFEETQKDSEDVSSDETVKEKEEEEEEIEEISVPAHKPKEIVQSKVRSKYFTKSKFIAVLQAVAFAFMVISVSDSTVIKISEIKDLSIYGLYVPPEIFEFAKLKFEVLVQKSRLRAAECYYYICKHISEFRGVQKSQLQYRNLSALLEENHLVDEYLKFAGKEFNNKENLMAPVGERDVKTETLEESHHDTEENEKDIENFLEEDNSSGFEEQVEQGIKAEYNMEEVLEDHTEPESEEACLPTLPEVIKPADLEAEQTEETVQSDVNNHSNLQSNMHVIHQTMEISEVTEIQPEVHVEAQVESSKTSYAEIKSTKAGENTQNTELDASLEDNQISATVENFLTRNVVEISSLVLLSLLAATVFFFNQTKKGKLSTTSNVTTPVGQSVITKKLDYSPISVAAENRFEQKQGSMNWQAGVNIMSGASASSEMSSFKSSSQSQKGLKTSSEAQSQERKPRKNYRRESLDSSNFSLSSVSYGSFTTYEKIPSKHGFVTPVRRSSRVRNLVTSP